MGAFFTSPLWGEVDGERSETSGEGFSASMSSESPSPGALRAADLSLRER
jgi:hypothetical protein